MKWLEVVRNFEEKVRNDLGVRKDLWQNILSQLEAEESVDAMMNGVWRDCSKTVRARNLFWIAAKCCGREEVWKKVERNIDWHA